VAARFEHLDQILFRHPAGGDGEHQVDEISLIKRRFPVVHQKECDRGVGADALLAVDAGVVLAKAESVSGCHCRHGRMQELATERCLRCGYRRFERRRIANPGRATVSLDLLLVDFKNILQCKEERLHGVRRVAYSASFLNALP